MRTSWIRSVVFLCAAVLPGLGIADLANAQPPGVGSAGALSFTQASYNFFEEDGVVSISVRRHQGSTGAVTVEWEAAPGTATSADFVPASGVLEWGDGDSANKAFEVELLDDEEIEGLETVLLTLRNATGGASLFFAPTEATLRIMPSDQPEDDGEEGEEDEEEGEEDEGEEEDDGEGDDDGDLVVPPEGLIRFDQRTFQVRENVGSAVITVRRTGGSVGEVTVDYTTADASAVAPDDYESTSGTLTFGDGEEGLRTFLVPIVDDTEAEPTERIQLMLDGVTGGALLHPDHDVSTLLVFDDDRNIAPDRSEGVITFSAAEFQVIEGDVLATITVERRFGNRGAVQVDYETADGSAEAGLDYEAVSGTLTWGRGDEAPKTFTVPILADEEEEGSETVQLLLTNLQGSAELSESGDEATLQILDDDSSLTTCVPDDETLCFQEGRFQATVVWRAANGTSGDGNAAPLSDQSGIFWFFDQENSEMLVKLLDACSVAGLEGFWFFVAATTDLDFTLKVTDTTTGLSKEYSNMLGQAASPVLDALTFRSCSG
jgi:hypothetical protein